MHGHTVPNLKSLVCSFLLRKWRVFKLIQFRESGYSLLPHPTSGQDHKKTLGTVGSLLAQILPQGDLLQSIILTALCSSSCLIFVLHLWLCWWSDRGQPIEARTSMFLSVSGGTFSCLRRVVSSETLPTVPLGLSCRVTPRVWPVAHHALLGPESVLTAAAGSLRCTP